MQQRPKQIRNLLGNSQEFPSAYSASQRKKGDKKYENHIKRRLFQRVRKFYGDY